MSPRPLAFTDDQLLAAAASAIADVGPNALTLADVASRTGASPATLVKRFGSKHGLLVAVSRRGVDEVGRAFRDPRAEDVPALVRLENVLAALTADVRRHDQMAHHVAFLMMDLTHPDLYAQAREFTAALRAGIRALLVAAAGVGELTGFVGAREPVDAASDEVDAASDEVDAGLDELVEAVLTVYHGTMITWALEPRGVLSERIRTRLRFQLAPYRRAG